MTSKFLFFFFSLLNLIKHQFKTLKKKNNFKRDLHAALGNLDGATARCFGLTDWGGASSLFVVVFDILAEYTQQFSRLLKSLRTASGLFFNPFL